MACRCAAPLLAHLNLLLTIYGGAALATAARLKWDPSTYVVLRELFPAEYAATAAASAGGGALLLLLPHVAAAALHASSRAAAAVLLYIYAGAMALLVALEAAFGAWLVLQVQAWLASEDAAQLAEAMQLRENLKPILQYFSKWYPLPHRIEDLIKEVEDDGPRNMYVAMAAVLVLLLLQLLVIALALVAASRKSSGYAPLDVSTLAKHNYSVGRAWRWRGAVHCVTAMRWSPSAHSKARLRTAYRNGRIVIL